MARTHGERERNFVGQHWARGYFVFTVGRDEAAIRKWIKNQQQEDKRLDQLNRWRWSPPSGGSNNSGPRQRLQQPLRAAPSPKPPAIPANTYSHEAVPLERAATSADFRTLPAMASQHHDDRIWSPHAACFHDHTNSHDPYRKPEGFNRARAPACDRPCPHHHCHPGGRRNHALGNRRGTKSTKYSHRCRFG